MPRSYITTPPEVGTGDVVGPGSSVNGDIAIFSGTTGKLIADGGMALPDSSGTVGYLNLPVNSQSVDYTAVAADSGKLLIETGASKTLTIPANASVPYVLGTAISFTCTDAGGCNIAITTDTLIWTSGGTGTRTLAQYGLATAIKIAATTWLISGDGLS